jgi:quaternary ammonium compound-resistance protein SugE
MEAKQKKNSRIAWICLIAAGLIEIVWAYFMKLSYGFTRPLPTLITAFFLALSFFMLERGIREFGIGMSYAIFTGIGIAGTTVLGLVFFGESAGVLKIVSLLVLLAGIIGLKFCESDEENEKNEKNEGNEDGSGAAAADEAAGGAGNCGKERD